MTTKLDTAIVAAKEARKVSNGALKVLATAQKRVTATVTALEKALAEQDAALVVAGTASANAKTAAAALAKAQPTKAVKAKAPKATVAAAPVAAPAAPKGAKAAKAAKA